MDKTKRIDWIDQARGILFIFVIICHSCLASDWLKCIYEPFFLTGFFFISGYLYKDKQLEKKVTSIVNGLFVPFLIYCFIWGGISFVHTFSLDNALSVVWDSFKGGDQVWFIPSLILVEIIYVLARCLPNRHIINSALIVFAVLSNFITTSLSLERGFWCWETSLFALGFYALGDMCKGKLLNERGKSTILMFVYILLCLGLQRYGFLQDIDMHLNRYSYPLAFVCVAPIGCYAFMSFLSHVATNKYVVEFGRYTLFLFPFHGLVLRNLMKLLEKIDVTFNNILLLLILVSATVLICFVLARYIYMYVPLLGGKIKVI